MRAARTGTFSAMATSVGSLSLAVLALSLLTPHIFAQGTVVFVNDRNSVIRYDSSLFGGAAVPRNSCRAGLYWGAEGTVETNLIQIGPSVPIIAPGRIRPTPITTPKATPPGARATFQVRVWSAEFETYEAALGKGWTGKSVVWTQGTGGKAPADPPELTRIPSVP
jgi:hypothetical protein